MFMYFRLTHLKLLADIQKNLQSKPCSRHRHGYKKGYKVVINAICNRSSKRCIKKSLVMHQSLQIPGYLKYLRTSHPDGLITQAIQLS
ncbi:hypothetical protein HA466_0311360 [Hirschfeldia incana]|nr:hypothetical protein HA466_0311360 [Hirschfeldia incana]